MVYSTPKDAHVIFRVYRVLNVNQVYNHFEGGVGRLLGSGEGGGQRIPVVTLHQQLETETQPQVLQGVSKKSEHQSFC